ncbi:MAG TPA: sigma-70 family RNA polymerase sigma factor [Polyangiaceae bacterium]
MAAEQRGPARRAPEVERSVLARCKAGDPIAFRAFVVRYERVVFALLSRVIGGGAHVEDLAQETFLRAYRAFSSFDVDGAARPSTWLLTIATRLALDAKKRRAPIVAPLKDGNAVAAASTPENERSRGELGRAIARAASELPDDQRAAFVLAELHDFSVAEIAVALGVPENTAKTRLFRAREKMRASLEAWRGGA